MKSIQQMEYVYIPKSTLDAVNLSNEHHLTEKDIIQLNVHKELISKFIDQKAVALQFDIGSGNRKGEEELYLKVVDVLHEIAEDVRKMQELFNNYKQMKEDEENEKDDE